MSSSKAKTISFMVLKHISIVRLRSLISYSFSRRLKPPNFMLNKTRLSSH